LLGQILATETPPSVDLIVAGQRLLGFDSSKSSSTANVRWTCFIDIAVDGQSYSWAFYINIFFDGQRPLDLISSTHRRRPGSLLDFLHRNHRRWPASAGLSSSTSPSMASVRWT
jgi:hypothetical protein